MGLWEIVINFLISLLASLIAVLIALWIERQKRPELSMRVGNPHVLESDPLRRPNTIFTRVEVGNRPIVRWLRPFVSREPALACRGWITFHYLDDGRRVFDREMSVRWSETPQPTLRSVYVPGGEGNQFENTGVMYSTVDTQSSIDIHPNESTLLDLVVRFDGESECYGWNNESYLHNWRHPTWRLEKGRYIAKVRLKANGREFTDAFIVQNDVSYQHFRVEPADRELMKRLK